MFQVACPRCGPAGAADVIESVLLGLWRRQDEIDLADGDIEALLLARVRAQADRARPPGWIPTSVEVVLGPTGATTWFTASGPECSSCR
jgi:hypothetical protein